MSGYAFSINQYYASVHLFNRGDPENGHYRMLHIMLNFMKYRGFQVGRDPEIQKHYKCLNKDHWYGTKAKLEFKAQRYPAGFEVQFFQNVIVANKSGGQYDCDKYNKMPYLIKLLFRNEMGYIKRFLEQMGCADVSDPVYKTSEDAIKQHYVKDCHHPQQSMGFELKDLNGQTLEHSYNHIDRDGKVIRNGDVKYFRHCQTGRLTRGVVYYNINNMWWLILNKTQYTNKASFELFDLTKKDFIARRLKQDNKPKNYLERKSAIGRATTQELINELKRRGVRGFPNVRA